MFFYIYNVDTIPIILNYEISYASLIYCYTKRINYLCEFSCLCGLVIQN